MSECSKRKIAKAKKSCKRTSLKSVGALNKNFKFWYYEIFKKNIPMGGYCGNHIMGARLYTRR
jgi:hypothetical protein